MFVKRSTKKIISLVITLMMLASFFTVAEGSSITQTYIDTDFSTYTDTSGSVAPQYLTGSNINGTNATITPVADDTYGTVARLYMPKSDVGAAIGQKISAVDQSKTFVVETAIKRTKIEGGDFALRLWGNWNIPVRFAKDGKIYFNGSNSAMGTEVGSYETGVWYDIKVEFSETDDILKLKINGGKYENVQLSGTLGNVSVIKEYDFAVENKVQNKEFDGYLGYLKTYACENNAAKNNIQVSFENFALGSLSQSVTKSDDSNAYKFGSGFKASKNDADSAFEIAKTDEEYGKSLKLNGKSGIKQLVFPFASPYAAAFASGTHYVDFSLKVGQGMDISAFAENGSQYFNAFYFGKDDQTKVYVGSSCVEGYELPFTWQQDKWYRISIAFNMDTKEMKFKIFDPENPSASAEKTHQISDYSAISQFSFFTMCSTETNTASYIDNIRIYQQETPKVLSVTPVNGLKNASFNQEAAFTLNVPVDASSITAESVTFEGEGITSANDYEVYVKPDGNTIAVKPANRLSLGKEYTVTLNSVKDIWGNAIKDAKQVKFTTVSTVNVTSIVNEDFSNFLDTSGKAVTTGNLNTGGADNSLAIIMPEQDDTYGTVAHLSVPSSNKNMSIGRRVAAIADDKVIVFETAIKRKEITGGDFALRLWGTGAQPVKFGKDGMIYVADQVVGGYDADTWYNVKIEYLKSESFLKVTVNGGVYENTQFVKEWNLGSITSEFDWAFADYSANKKSDVYLGYLNAYTTEIYSDGSRISISFEGHKEGAISQSAYQSNASGAIWFGNGFNCNASAANAFSIASVDEEYGKSLKISGNSVMNQYVLPLASPYAKNFSGGTHYVDFSFRIGEGMYISSIPEKPGAYFYGFRIGDNDKTGLYVGDNKGEDKKLAFVWENDKWYRMSIAFDMAAKVMTLKIYDPENPATYAEKTHSISGYDFLSQIALIAGAGSNVSTYSYIDDIRIYEKADSEVLSATPVNGKKNVINEDNVIYFSVPLDAATVNENNITIAGDGITSSDDYEVSLMPGTTSVKIKPLVTLKGGSTYTVNVNTSVKNVWGSSLMTPYSYSFVAGEFISVSETVFKNVSAEGKVINALENGNISATTSVSFGDGKEHTVTMMLALYDKTTKRLLDVDYYCQTIASDDITLHVNVTDAANSYVSLFVWDGVLSPYIDPRGL